MVIFNALLNLRELKELYSGKPVCVCPLYNGVLNISKTFEATGNPITIPEYKSMVKLTTKFSPKQAGTGNPSPDNVRPISGYDDVTVTQSKDGSQVKQITLTLPETIYGGTVDAVTGVGEKTWEFVEFDGTEEWNTWGYNLENNVTGVYLYFKNNYPAGDYPSVSYSSILPYNSSAYKNTTGQRVSKGPYQLFIMSFPSSFFSGVTSTEGVVPYWKSYLATQAAAGTPVQVAYKLATPEPFKVSQVSIPSLRGENTFFTNGENMDIIYKETSFWGGDGACLILT